MLKKLKKNKSKTKNQQIFTLEQGAANIKDHLAPSLIKELAPGELTAENIKTNDYFVEMGAGTELARYFRSFTATMTSATTYAGMLNQLYQADFGDADVDVVLHLTPTDTGGVLNNLSRMIAGLESDLDAVKSSSERDRILDSIMDLKEQVRRVRRNIEKMFLVSIQAVVSGNNLQEVGRFSKALIKRFSGQGVVLRPNDRVQLEALTGMTPFDNTKTINHSFRNMESSNIADLFPFGQGGTGHTDGIIIGVDNYNNLVFLDTWHPTLLNSHMVILGRAGAGKGVSIKVIIGRGCYLGIKTAIIDPDRKQEYLSLVQAYGGSYFSLGPNSKHNINFFDVDVSEDKNGRLTVELEEAINNAQAIILKMISEVSPQILEDGLVKLAIREKIRQLYNSFGITEDPSSLYEENYTPDSFTFSLGKGRLKRMPTLSDFYNLIKQDEKLEKTVQAIRIFTKEGNDPTMSIFDCETNVNIRNDMVFAFSIGELEPTIMKPLGMFVATKWLTEKFGQQDRLQKKRIVIDESQELLKYPDMAERLEMMFRQLRKYNCSMVSVTQGFEVFMRVPEGLGILKNATIKLFLRQEAIDFEDIKDKFNLTEGEMNFLLTTPTGVGLLMIDNQSTVVQVIPTQKELELYNTDPNLFIKEIIPNQRR